MERARRDRFITVAACGVSAQQPGQQGDKGNADQGNASARDELLNTLALY